MSFKFLEDWLLYMGGHINALGQDIKDPWRNVSKPIKLATYDTRFVESVCAGIKNQNGLTDRQVLLAIKIILKYKRQWAQLGLDPSYMETQEIELKLPQRQVDRTHSAWIENKKIYIKFPYDPKIINKLNSNGDSPGNWQWHTDNKYWSMDLIEWNVHQLMRINIFNEKEWQLDANLRELLDLAKVCMYDTSIVPTMDLVDGKLQLINCPESLVDSMQWHGYENADMTVAGLLAKKHGVDISRNIMEAYEPSDPRRLLLASQFPNSDDYPGASHMTWAQLEDLMNKLPFLNWVFVYRSHVMPKVLEKTKNINCCSKEYITVKAAQMTEQSQVPKQSVVVSDVVIGVPAGEMINQHLAVLYMIADDERVNA